MYVKLKYFVVMLQQLVFTKHSAFCNRLIVIVYNLKHYNYYTVDSFTVIFSLKLDILILQTSFMTFKIDIIDSL